MVVGGTGYIGSHMVSMIVEEGHDVVAFDNLSLGQSGGYGCAKLIVCDLLSPADLSSAFGGTTLRCSDPFRGTDRRGRLCCRPGTLLL